MTTLKGDPWCCKKCGKVLGARVRKHHDGRNVEILVTAAGPEIEGHASIPCSCGCWREWMQSKQSVEQ